MRGSALLPLALLLSLGLAAALPSSYQCTPGNGVVCASNSAPDGLTPAETPQLVVLSHDDAITVTTNKAVRGAVNQFVNSNGCNVPFTFFVSGGAGTNCAIARRLQNDNHEIATHTLAHAQLVPGTINITEQIGAQRAWLNTACGIPLDSIRGFRAPYLLHNPESRAALQALGFQYDSSIIESWPSLTSPSSASRLFPYSMASGIPQDCQWMAPATCSASERYSLFEIPMLQFISSSGVALSSMDPTADSSAALADQMMQQLKYSYNGNRSPMGIYLHTPWFVAKPFHAEALSTFVQQALAMPDVWFVTYSQLVAWMQSPVPASQMMRSWLKCAPVDFAAEARPACSTYTVAESDSLFKICADQEVELLELLAANPSLTQTSAIYVGQRLHLPPWDATCVEDGLVCMPPCRNHTAAAGDYLYGVAMAYNLTIDDLVGANANMTKTSTLSIGQVLRIPPWPAVECFYGNWSLPARATLPADGALSPAPAPTPGSDLASCGAEVVELELTLTGFDAATFQAHMPQFVAGMGALVRVPPTCVALQRLADFGLNAAGQRRLLAERSPLSDNQLLAVVLIRTANATQTREYLRDAEQLGSLSIMLNLLGAQVDKAAATALNAQGLPIGTSSSTSPAPVPSPSLPVSAPATPTTSSPQPAVVMDAGASVPASGGSSSNLGAILGGAIGGACGALLVIAGVVFFVRRRKATVSTGPGTAGLRSNYAVHNPTFAGAGASAYVSTSGAAPSKPDAFELTEVVEQTGTPSSARRRATAPFS